MYPGFMVLSKSIYKTEYWWNYGKNPKFASKKKKGGYVEARVRLFQEHFFKSKTKQNSSSPVENSHRQPHLNSGKDLNIFQQWIPAFAGMTYVVSGVAYVASAMDTLLSFSRTQGSILELLPKEDSTSWHNANKITQVLNLTPKKTKELRLQEPFAVLFLISSSPVGSSKESEVLETLSDIQTISIWSKSPIGKVWRVILKLYEGIVRLILLRSREDSSVIAEGKVVDSHVELNLNKTNRMKTLQQKIQNDVFVLSAISLATLFAIPLAFNFLSTQKIRDGTDGNHRPLNNGFKKGYVVTLFEFLKRIYKRITLAGMFRQVILIVVYSMANATVLVYKILSNDLKRHHVKTKKIRLTRIVLRGIRQRTNPFKGRSSSPISTSTFHKKVVFEGAARITVLRLNGHIIYIDEASLRQSLHSDRSKVSGVDFQYHQGKYSFKVLDKNEEVFKSVSGLEITIEGNLHAVVVGFGISKTLLARIEKDLGDDVQKVSVGPFQQIRGGDYYINLGRRIKVERKFYGRRIIVDIERTAQGFLPSYIRSLKGMGYVEHYYTSLVLVDTDEKSSTYNLSFAGEAVRKKLKNLFKESKQSIIRNAYLSKEGQGLRYRKEALGIDVYVPSKRGTLRGDIYFSFGRASVVVLFPINNGSTKEKIFSLRVVNSIVPTGVLRKKKIDVRKELPSSNNLGPRIKKMHHSQVEVIERDGIGYHDDVLVGKDGNRGR